MVYGLNILNAVVVVSWGRVLSEMSSIYGMATVCLKDAPLDCQTLEPGTHNTPEFIINAPRGNVTILNTSKQSDTQTNNVFFEYFAIRFF